MNRMHAFGVAVLVGIATCAVAQAGQKATFDDQAAITAWTITGDVSIDGSRDHSGEGGSLRVGPGGKAVWKVRNTDGSGKVEMWVYDDQTKAAKPKDYRVGPRWGLIQSDGRVLVVGVLYAPYLGGDTTYAASDSDQKTTWFAVQYLAVRRNEGWHKWTFDFSADRGLSIAYDGKDVNAQRERFDWNKTKIKGFCGVALFGDEGEANQHTIWVDDLTVELGGPVQVEPVPPPPPPPAVPEKDPEPEHRVELVERVKGKHPRLLFTAEDIPAMKRLAQSEGKVFFKQLNDYLGPSVPPGHTNFLTDATDAQRQGLWRLPTVALHYVLTGDEWSLGRTVAFMKKFLALDYWERGQERDSGMGAANIMIGAALAYDWTYNELDPEFREAFRKKLLLHARRMYYRGHLQKGGGGAGYWQQDPQNNHRWHRNAGLALSVLAVAGDGPGDDWILARTLDELRFVARWLPEDGTSHEGPSYMAFGGGHLLLAFDAADRCLGTNFLDHAFFKETVSFRMQTLTPGLKNVFGFGDSAGAGGYNNYLFKCASHHKMKDHQAGLMELLRLNPDSLWIGWWSLVWYDPATGGGAVGNLPLSKFFPDLGLAFMRDGWEEHDVGVMFKCAPYGGARLNEYRNENEGHYINVAHDDPDANMFLIYAKGRMLAETDRYAYHKVTSSHNTILVNGTGQKGEGHHWTQPLGKSDMSDLAYVTAWKDAGDVAAVEGEASGAYDALERYRRTLIWVPASYILILDDIRAEREAEIAWLVQGVELETVDRQQSHYRLKNGHTHCDFRVAADKEFAADVVRSTAQHRGSRLGWAQLQLKARTDHWRVATVFDPWNHGGLRISMTPDGENAAVITITGPDISDTWTWQAPPDDETPSTLKGRRKGASLVEVGPKDKVERR